MWWIPFRVLCVLLFLSSWTNVFGQVETSSEITVPAIIKEGSEFSSQNDLEDEIVPSRKGKTRFNSAGGSIVNSLQNQLPVPMSETGTPGELAQVRGLGSSPEDMDVQVFGLSLNPPQGGGFDLSVFPQFLWSDYQFQFGPPLSTQSMTATAGTLNLIPWTASSLGQSGWSAKASNFYSSRGVNQISAAGRMKDVAAVAGYSSLRAQGPSGGFSAKVESGGYQGSVHLLASDLDGESPGSTMFPAPNARARKTRVIPVLQNDFHFANGGSLKSSFFYDLAKIDYNNPDSGSGYRNDIQQWGGQGSYWVDRWKIGTGFRQVRYSDFNTFRNEEVLAPLQNLAHVQLSREIPIASLSIEPAVRGEWATGFGGFPEASLGARWRTTQGSVFSRATLSRRLPSLLDRYAMSGDYVGNPDLQTELDGTFLAGAETDQRVFGVSLVGYTQLKQNARVLGTHTVTNQGNAHVLSLVATGRYRATPWLELTDSAVVSASRLYATGNDFPYLPGISNVLGAEVRQKDWEWISNARMIGSRLYSFTSEERLPADLVFDTGVSYHLTRQITLVGRVENVFDRSFEMIRGYPIGRAFSVMLTGEI